MQKTFDYYFDFGSPASYLAFTQLGKLTADTGATAIHKPMLLGGVFQATGNHSPVTIPAKGKYTFTDFARFAKRYGVPLVSNPHFPINTLMLMRGAMGLQMSDAARFMPYCQRHLPRHLGRCQKHERPCHRGTGIARRRL